MNRDPRDSISSAELAMIVRANHEHDRQHPNFIRSGARIRSTWPKVMVGRKLTDKQIDRYGKKGWYSPEFKQARKDLQLKKAAAQQQKPNGEREGNFVMRDGRLIYSPVN